MRPGFWMWTIAEGDGSMRTGMSWCAATLIVAALVAGHRQWGRSASAGPPATLPQGQPSAPLQAIPHRDRALKAVAADDEFSPQELRPQRPAEFEILGAAFRPADNLRLAVAVAEIDKQHAAMIAQGIHPAAQSHSVANVRGAQLAAGMSAQMGALHGWVFGSRVGGK